MTFKTIKENVTAEIVEKKSKFIASVFYVENIDDADRIIKETRKKYHDARHNCFAYIVETGDGEGAIVKYNDDGEPSGTAGAPILNIIANEGMSNTLVIVTRYFGGILLGTGGLVRAYTESTKKALSQATFIQKDIGVEAKIIVDYSEVENVKYFLKQQEIKIISGDYLENVELVVEMNKAKIENFTNYSSKNTLKILNFSILREKYIEI